TDCGFRLRKSTARHLSRNVPSLRRRTRRAPANQVLNMVMLSPYPTTERASAQVALAVALATRFASNRRAAMDLRRRRHGELERTTMVHVAIDEEVVVADRRSLQHHLRLGGNGHAAAVVVAGDVRARARTVADVERGVVPRTAQAGPKR